MVSCIFRQKNIFIFSLLSFRFILTDFPLVSVRTASRVAASTGIFTPASGCGQVHGSLSGLQGFHHGTGCTSGCHQIEFRLLQQLSKTLAAGPVHIQPTDMDGRIELLGRSRADTVDADVETPQVAQLDFCPASNCSRMQSTDMVRMATISERLYTQP